MCVVKSNRSLEALTVKVQQIPAASSAICPSAGYPPLLEAAHASLKE